MKTVKFGIVTLQTTEYEEIKYKVVIQEEYGDDYIVKYIKQLNQYDIFMVLTYQFTPGDF